MHCAGSWAHCQFRQHTASGYGCCLLLLSCTHARHQCLAGGKHRQHTKKSTVMMTAPSAHPPHTQMHIQWLCCMGAINNRQLLASQMPHPHASRVTSQPCKNAVTGQQGYCSFERKADAGGNLERTQATHWLSNGDCALSAQAVWQERYRPPACARPVKEALTLCLSVTARERERGVVKRAAPKNWHTQS